MGIDIYLNWKMQVLALQPELLPKYEPAQLYFPIMAHAQNVLEGNQRHKNKNAQEHIQRHTQFHKNTNQDTDKDTYKRIQKKTQTNTNTDTRPPGPPYSLQEVHRENSQIDESSGIWLVCQKNCLDPVDHYHRKVLL